MLSTCVHKCWVGRSKFKSWSLPQSARAIDSSRRHQRAGGVNSAYLWQKAFNRFALQENPVDGQRVLELAIDTGCSSYDTEFVVLAQHLGCRLLTFDRKLLKLFPDLAMQPA